ncbi:MAG: DUF1028 domain-containing protein [Candidatus Promineifilaceae bacterium]
MNRSRNDALKDGAKLLLAAAASILALALSLGGLQDKSDNSRTHPSTWSIVAMDVESGDVGAAGASCVPVNASVLAALVPSKGAAAIQAEFNIENRDTVFDLLQRGFSADEILEEVAVDSFDPRLSLRQYGVVTMRDGAVETAGFTGEGNFAWAGDVQDEGLAVSVQGNTLESEDVVGWALEAFKAEDLGPLQLPDRLIRALEAGSAAGGDKRCNQDGKHQTALTAFVAVSKADQAPFTAPLTDTTEISSPDLPWLYAAVIEEQGGPNPLIELRRLYDEWRLSHLPPCPECEIGQLELPGSAGTQVDLTEPASQNAIQPDQAVETAPAPIPSTPDASSNRDQNEAAAESGDSSIIPQTMALIAAVLVAAVIGIYFYARRSKSSSD